MLDVALFVIFYGSYLAGPLLAYLIYHIIKKRRFWHWAAAFFVLLFIYARFVEPNIIRIRPETIDLAGKGNGIKVAVISDIHSGVFSGKQDLRRIVRRVNEIKPDLVLLPGDLVFRLPVKKFSIFSELNKIDSPLGVVLGNHDHGRPRGTDVSVELEAALKEAGILVLDNKSWQIEIKDHWIKVVGLSDYYNNDADFSLLKRNSDNNDQLVIALSHNPDIVYQYPTSSAADITISGHTHGGQIRLPFIYRSLIPTDYDFDAGLYKIGDYPVFVSAGLGSVGLPLRFFRGPEINVLELK